jgi:hypothetical protein
LNTVLAVGVVRCRRPVAQYIHQGTVTHAVRNDVELRESKARRDNGKKSRQMLCRPYNACSVGDVAGHLAVGRPTVTKRDAGELEVEGELRRAHQRVFERHVEAMDEKQPVAPLAAACIGLPSLHVELQTNIIPAALCSTKGRPP